MYDFHFGTEEEIRNNIRNYIIFIKRLMPRWLNGIPDSECLAIWDTLSECEHNEKPVVVETGSGSSTICLVLHSILNGGKAFTWDINPCRGAELKGLLNETLARDFNVNLGNFWQFVPGSSVDPFLGLNILKEYGVNVDFCFLDSLHTSNHLIKEVELVADVVKNEAIFAIDDANYRNKEYNYSYCNIQRKKLGLPPINEPSENIGVTYHERVGSYLDTRFSTVRKLKNSYIENYEKDIFFDYFKIDKDVMNNVGMEVLKDLGHRFECWQVRNRI